MNYQRTTKNNRPIIDRSTKLPVYNMSVEKRTKLVVKQLFEIPTIGFKTK